MTPTVALRGLTKSYGSVRASTSPSGPARPTTTSLIIGSAGAG